MLTGVAISFTRGGQVFSCSRWARAHHVKIYLTLCIYCKSKVNMNNPYRKLYEMRLVAIYRAMYSVSLFIPFNMISGKELK